MAVTLETVAAWGRFNVPEVGSVDETLLEGCIAAATAQLAREFYLDEAEPETADIAVTMQAVRLWSRRNTPEGRSAFGGDVAVTVTSFDADVHALLEPRFGIS